MKKSKKENLKIAKKFFKISLSNNDLDRAKIKIVVGEIKKLYKRTAVGILKSFVTIMQNKIRRQTLTIESTQSLNNNEVAKLKRSFEKKSPEKITTQLKQNPNILGGLKITLDDTQWDYSIKGKIDQMKEILNERYSS